MSNTKEKIQEILSHITAESVQDMDEEKIKECLEMINPYHYVGDCTDKYLNFSFTKQADIFQEKFLVSAMVGYLFRAVNEWKVPQGIKPVLVDEWAKDPSLADTPKTILENGSEDAKEAYEVNRNFMKYRAVVMAFLESIFQFNPDVHCQPGHRPNPNDKDRKPIDSKAGKLAHDYLLATDKDYQAAYDLKQELDNLKPEKDAPPAKPKKAKKTTKKKSKAPEKLGVMTPEEWSEFEAATPVKPKKTTRKKSKAPEKPEDQEPADLKQQMEDKLSCYNLTRKYIPPSDLFYRFRMYQDENIEHIRRFVADCYGEVLQLDLALQPLSVHDTEQEAEEYKKKRANEFTVDVFTARFGFWCMLESSEARRNNVRYYNKQNRIFEEIIEQAQRDAKLGTELLSKRVRKAKKENVRREGPDPEGLERWKAENTQLRQLGAEFSKLHPDLPEDAVQTEIWDFQNLENPKTVAFLEAEAPTVPEMDEMGKFKLK
jgi:hypothetical protein